MKAHCHHLYNYSYCPNRDSIGTLPQKSVVVLVEEMVEEGGVDLAAAVLLVED
jgi:hypothetical protein